MNHQLRQTIFPNGDVFFGKLDSESMQKTGFGELRTNLGDVILGDFKVDVLNGVAKMCDHKAKEYIG